MQYEQVGVDDDDVGPVGALSGGFGEAGSAFGAAGPAGTLRGAHAQALPQSRREFPVHVGPVAGGGPVGPGEQPGEVLGVTGPGWPVGGIRWIVRFAGDTQFELKSGPGGLGDELAADVVGASLQDGPAERPAAGSQLPCHGQPGQERQFLGGQLILQRLRRRGHDHPFAAQDGGNEVGQRLSRSRACGDRQVSTAFEGLGGGRGHLLLAGPSLACGAERLGGRCQQGETPLGETHPRRVPTPLQPAGWPRFAAGRRPAGPGAVTPLVPAPARATSSGGRPAPQGPPTGATTATNDVQERRSADLPTGAP